MNAVMLSNQIRCLKCNDTPFSSSRHDYAECKCGACAVDGGLHMQRIIYEDDDTIEDMSVGMPLHDFEQLLELLKSSLVMGADHCCDVYIDYMKYPPSIKSSLLPAANWAIETNRNTLGLICAFVRTYRDGEFLS